MLYIVSTPIGNLEDITLRALSTFKIVDFILAEDTRKTLRLLKHFEVNKKVFSLYEYNEIKKIPWVVKELKQGKSIAVVSSAGTPTISDPGYNLVKECRRQEIPVTSLPGASSITCALSITSFAHDKFAFLGYIPRKKGARKKLFEKTKGWEVTLVFFESPFRLVSSLVGLGEIFGDRKIAIMREMTKKFEEIRESTPEEAIDYFKKNKPKGEFTLVVPYLGRKEKPISQKSNK